MNVITLLATVLLMAAHEGGFIYGIGFAVTTNSTAVELVDTNSTSINPLNPINLSLISTFLGSKWGLMGLKNPNYFMIVVKGKF